MGDTFTIGQGQDTFEVGTDRTVITVSYGATSSGGGGEGDVVGPASSVDGRPALFDGTTGKLLRVGAVNAPDGLLRLDDQGVAPDTQIASNIVRDTELASALAAARPEELIGSAAGDWVLVTPGTGSSTTNFHGSAGAANGTGLCVPFRLFDEMTFDAIGFECVAAANGGVFRCGVYAAPAGRPATVEVDAGTADATAPGVNVLALGAPVTLPAGRHLAVLAPQGLSAGTSNPTVRATATAGQTAPVTSLPSSTTAVLPFFRAAVGTGAFADNPAVTAVFAANPGLPLIWLRTST